MKPPRVAHRVASTFVAACATATIVGLTACAGERVVDGLPVVSANDNRHRAGTLRRDTLTVALVVRNARWYPEADPGPFVDAPAFGEEGGPPQVPAPLIRVTTGTVIAATIRNALPDSTLRIVGLSTKGAAPGDTIVIPPGETRTTTFAAGAPGTYMYRGIAGTFDLGEREQLGGAFVVDSVGALGDDRVFVMNVWGEPVDSTYRNAVTINGRSWPYTERISATTGDSVRWRWVNATIRPHPMHLHGFYFRVNAVGGLQEDTLYTERQQRTVVTEVMPPFGTMALAFQPERPGNWLFHCHIGFHVLASARLGPTEHEDHASGDVGRHMAGLVLGLNVSAARGWTEPPRENPHTVRLFVQEGTPRGRAARRMGYVAQSGGTEPAGDSVRVPGTPLILTQDRPTDITVVNRLNEPTAVHWHGIELESYSDGVVGFSGQGQRLAPMIAPADSFRARLTLPRPGTFIYHTHLNDLEQLTSGLYGALIVLPPREAWDPELDRVFVAGWDGHGDPPHLVINGDSQPPSAAMIRGVTYRLRFVNIGPAARVTSSIARGADTLAWRALAKDGADLPVHAATTGPAVFTLDVGETADFSFTPDRAGDHVLTFRIGPLPPVIQRIRVR